MRSQFHLAGRNRRTCRNASVSTLSVVLISICLADHADGQVGNQNPSGPSGIFNGQVTTGCSYDVYTGNATRSITDILVAGTVGEYPLALVRTSNSRSPSTTEWFGYAGGWNHNYNWTMEDSPRGNAQNFRPARYTGNFPDGRVETFRAVTWDPAAYRVRPGADTPAQSSSSGVRERLVPINPPNNMYAYLVLPDGGKVKFQATQYSSYGQYYYKYKATAIIDPHGLETTFTYEVVGNGLRRLTKVTEPAGRHLQFSYATNNGPRISQVTEYIAGVAKRSVQYYYTYRMLDRVVYYGNANWTARYQYIAANINPDLPPLLWTCDDPMYPGPMKLIAYEYKTGANADGTAAVYGQILNERYYNGATIGAPVSTLAVGTNGVNNNPTYRMETRGDGARRTFIYSAAGYLTWISDFMGHTATQWYDDKKYVNSVRNVNWVTTDYTNDPITGNVTQVQLPLTPDDTPGQGNTRPTVNYTYTNIYYLHTVEDEGHHTTTITRDGNNRVSRIDYPDGGWEFFTYDSAHFYQLSSHRMATGGWENWTYDGRHREETYRSPDSPSPSPSPSARYHYDDYDRVSGITDVLGASLGDTNHTTNFDYNLRGQLSQITLSTDPVDGNRHTIKSWYNPDGTMNAHQNELYRTTNCTYDDYRRLKSIQTPVRGWGDNGTYTTYFYYDANGTGDDYRYTDSNLTWVKLPSGKKTRTVYDDNRSKQMVTAGYGTSDAATTSYGYDNVGNVISVTKPLNHNNVTTLYDERNRPYSIGIGGQTTTITYDTAGRQKTVTRPNTQVITNVSFDAMNRVTGQSATQTPTGTARTTYAYYPGSGLLQTFQDPRLYNSNPPDQCSYTYDGMGRRRTLTYPAEAGTGAHRVERWDYDKAGRLGTYTARANQHQTFTYDGLNRLTDFSWDDGLTPSVHFDYDAASRLIHINNASGNITRAYYYDNLLRSETEQILLSGGRSKTVTYTYDADGNRASTQYPDLYLFGYSYTNRNQLWKVNNWATYVYNTTGNLTTRTLDANNTHSDYTFDSHDRATWIYHYLNGTTRKFNYAYDDAHSCNNRLWTRRLGSTLGDMGDAFSYDLSDEAIAVQHNVSQPQNVQQPITPQNIYYDSNGNRTWYTPLGVNKHYDPDTQHPLSNLNQYTGVIINGSPVYNLSYRADANLASYDNNDAAYYYDAQNRLTSATVGGQTMYFAYDGLNRQVSRKLGANGTPTFNVWDGWDLIEEYQSANNGATTARYVYGATGLIAALLNGQFYYYYQDASGSTSHVTDADGSLVEWYRYAMDGNPIFYDATDHVRTPNQSGCSVRHLFTGQQWYQEIGLYDLRNRFYSPDLGRFLQPDPIGFRGDRTNLYRYCRNNPVTRRDPLGLQDAVAPTLRDGHDIPEVERVVVPGENVPYDNPADHPSFNPMPGFAPIGGPGGGDTGGRPRISGITFEYHPPPRNSNSNTKQQSTPSNVPQQNPPTQIGVATLATPPVSIAPLAGVFSVWQVMLITAFNDRIGDHDNLLGPGSIATADLRYRPTDFNNRNVLTHAYTGTPVRAYPAGSAVTIYRQDGTVYAGTITDTGAGFAAHRPGLGLSDGAPGALWFDIWTPTGSEDPEWDLVLTQTGP